MTRSFNRLPWTPLTDELGAQVEIDLTAPISDDVRAELVDLFNLRQLLLFRHQDITLEQQMALANCFSPVVDDPPVAACATVKSGLGRFVTNLRSEANARGGEIQYHAEFAFLDPPLYGLSLWAESIPSDGAAATLFLSSFDAFRSFPAMWLERVSGLHAVHVRHDSYAGHAYRDATVTPDTLRSMAPLVYSHPRTGEPTLHFSPLYTHRVVEKSADDSRQFLDELEGELLKRGSHYRHIWQRHDLLIWDNIKVLHARELVTISDDFPRRLRRVPIGDPQRYAEYEAAAT